MIFCLTVCIIFLTGIVIYQQFAFHTGTKAKLREISCKLKQILDSNSDEKVMIFTDNKVLVELVEQINRMLEEGLTRFQRKLPGFADSDAVITGIETRTSSPVRITRNSESLEALGLQGLYPCGEGAGYAGGIVSAAVDGIRVAEQIMKKYAPIE